MSCIEKSEHSQTNLISFSDNFSGVLYELQLKAAGLNGNPLFISLGQGGWFNNYNSDPPSGYWDVQADMEKLWAPYICCPFCSASQLSRECSCIDNWNGGGISKMSGVHNNSICTCLECELFVPS